LSSLSLLAFLVLPVAAVCCLGMLAQSLMKRHGKLWGAWLVLMAASGAVWVYLFVEVAP
jgi:hypothetical protein